MSKTVKASELPGSAGGFTMGVWRAVDVPVGSEVGVVAAPASGAAVSGEREKFEAWAEKNRNAQLFRSIGNPGVYAYSDVQSNWETWQAAIAHQPPKAALTREVIFKLALESGVAGSYISKSDMVCFARAIEAASAPNAALVEALQRYIDLGHSYSYKEIEDARKNAQVALSSAGVEVAK